MSDAEVIYDVESYRIVRRHSDAGWTDSFEWKPGYDPDPLDGLGGEL